MIERIEIRNFAVAREVVVEPAAGLNVFTGETGAGKSIVVDALAFAFGARRGREVIAAGTDRASVRIEVVIGGASHVIERTVGQSGRSTARIDGETATLSDLESLGQRAVDIHGQAGQLAILRPARQLDALDTYAGLLERRSALGAVVRELRAVERRIAELSGDARERQRRIEQLTFEADEIEQAGFASGDEERLRDDAARLAAADLLVAEAARALTALDAEPLGEAVAAVRAIAAHDSTATEVEDLAASLETVAGDLARVLRHYREGIETDPAALDFVEQRLDLLARLKRKYGNSVEEILAYAADARARLAEMGGAAESMEELEARRHDLLLRVGAKGAELSQTRRKAAASLVAEIGRELVSLGMGNATLAVGFAVEDDEHGPQAALPDYEVIGPDGYTPAEYDDAPRAVSETGFDRLEFLATFNAGETPRPLATVASGGETSRFFLALTTVLSRAAEPRLAVFDEVDEGVGGRSGSLVGEALARLAQHHQVFCITHLPQVAVYGGRHFVVSKTVESGRTGSSVCIVQGDERRDELASMLGAVTEANRVAAAELLAAVAPTPRPRSRPKSA